MARWMNTLTPPALTRQTSVWQPLPCSSSRSLLQNFELIMLFIFPENQLNTLSRLTSFYTQQKSLLCLFFLIPSFKRQKNTSCNVAVSDERSTEWTYCVQYSIVYSALQFVLLVHHTWIISIPFAYCSWSYLCRLFSFIFGWDNNISQTFIWFFRAASMSPKSPECIWKCFGNGTKV